MSFRSSPRARRLVLLSLAAALPASTLVAAGSGWGSARAGAWSTRERALLSSLSLNALPAPKPDPSNRVADVPAAARLGARLFRDTRLSADGRSACVTCHDPDRGFARPGNADGHGDRLRDVPSLVPAAHADWFFWDGRRDSQWAQALVPLESRSEQGAARMDAVRVVLSAYGAEYRALFGTLPDVSDERRFPATATPLGQPAQRALWNGMSRPDQQQVGRVFANVGKALAAYQRTLRFAPGRLDRYVEAIARGDRREAGRYLSRAEERGLRLFVGKAGCVACHSGPLLTNHEFFSVGLPSRHHGIVDFGRGDALLQVAKDPFNCDGPFSDAGPEDCDKLRFMVREPLTQRGMFRVPSLRNVAATAPYMHGGQLATLEAVVAHYDAGVTAEPRLPMHVRPLNLTAEERRELVALLRALDAAALDPLAANATTLATAPTSGAGR